MPYIEPRDRDDLDPVVDDLLIKLKEKMTAGALAYVVTRLIDEVWVRDYVHFAAILGVLESVTQEFYRRRIVPYEDKKKKENGDVF